MEYNDELWQIILRTNSEKVIDVIFEVKHVGYEPTISQESKAYLVIDNWNDWWEYKTMYDLYVIFERKIYYIGKVKIDEFQWPISKKGLTYQMILIN